MKTVLYTEEMEPITVLEITPQIASYFARNGIVNLAVMEPCSFLIIDPKTPPRTEIRYVRIWRELFVRHGQNYFFLFTRDDESALLLKAAFLPGQYQSVQDEKRSAFARGFISAFMQLGADED